MTTALVNTETIPNVLDELEKAFYEIPFENSDFQTYNFVLAAQQTPARAYRALGLRMFSKIQAVKEHLWAKEKVKIDIMEKESILEDPNVSRFDKMRTELDLKKIQDGSGFSEKLLNDAMHELNILWEVFKTMPKFTRAQFEAEEERHFRARLERQMRFPGPAESMQNMDVDRASIEQEIQRLTALSSPGNHFKLEG